MRWKFVESSQTCVAVHRSPSRPGYRLTGLALIFLLTVQGCSVFVGDSTTAVSPTTTEEQQKKPAEDALPPKPFGEDTLYNLLVGELAVYDRDLATAAASYQHEAQITRDSAIAERAAKLTRYLRDERAAVEMAELWYELEPTDPRAADNLADLYSRINRPLQALDVLEAQHNLGHSARFGLLRNSNFSSDTELNEVIDRLAVLSKDKKHENFSLIFTHTLLLQKSGQTEAALEQLHALDRFESDPVQLALIESQLLSELERHREAVQVLARAKKKFPQEKRISIAHARKLTKVDLPEAEEALAALLVDDGDDKDLLMTHALVAAENKNFEESRNSLEKLLALGQSTSFAHYNLGLIAHQQQELETALTHYEKVGPGKHLLPATQKIIEILQSRKQIQAARDLLSVLRDRYPRIADTLWSYEAHLLSENNEHEAAYQVLSDAILRFPQAHQLRMERSYVSEKLNRIDLVEQDLRYVLEREPNDPNALNALGYILADRTNRYVEARDLIEKAVALLPDNAAVIDSLGWVLYKQGEIEQAIQHLERAFDMIADDEVAAHLIEVHWQNNSPGAARKVYKKIRKATEQTPKVDATLERLNIEF